MSGPAPSPSEEEIRGAVRERYGAIASGGGCCGGSASGAPAAASCCGPGAGSCGSESNGYAREEIATLPPGADLGLGCGHPTALASLRPGEVVVDLGSGGGIDCFLAARRVGPTGRAIGVDMTPAMVARARDAARRSGLGNVEFRLGEIEHLPLADASADVVISNCVVNLAPDKGAVYREAHRVLRPGGRLVLSDLVATRPMRPDERANLARWSRCSSGALPADEIEREMRAAGFSEITISRRASDGDGPDADADGVVAADITARRR